MSGSNITGPYQTQSSTNLVQNAYDRMAYFALRPELYFDQVADVRATNLAMPGQTVNFTIVNDLAVAATALSETTDVTPVSYSDSNVQVTLAEYGNSLVTTAKLRGTAFVDVDPVVANVIGYNAGVSLDSIARNTLDAGTQVAYAVGTQGSNGVTARSGLQQIAAGTSGNSYLTSADLRTARARLRSQNVPTFGGSYVAFIHPDSVVDIQQETSTSLLNWRAPHTYSAPSEIWTGDLGQYEGFRFIETPRAPVFEGQGYQSGSQGTYTITTPAIGVQAAASTGSGTFTGAAPVVGATLSSVSGGATISGTVKIATVVGNTFTFAGTSGGTVTAASSGTTNTVTVSAWGTNVYATLCVGRQSLAKAHALADGNGPLPSIVPGPVTDLLRRWVPLGWYWLGGFSIFRQASVYRIESTSSLGADVQGIPEPTDDIS